ncbi:MAG: hypothetical protein C0458_05380 [Methylobacterium sp.]|nr:hypothetical protein [Methylobacterium sp.]
MIDEKGANDAPCWYGSEQADAWAAGFEAARLAYESAKQKGADGWRDIASAPKDGEIFLGTGPEEAWPVAMLWQSYDADDAAEIGSDGYWTYAEQLIADVTGEAKPTHWRPLPEPPSALAGGEG